MPNLDRDRDPSAVEVAKSVAGAASSWIITVVLLVFMLTATCAVAGAVLGAAYAAFRWAAGL